MNLINKKPFSVGLVSLLILSMALLTAPTIAKPPTGIDEGSIWVEPDYVNGSDVGVGNNFVVELWVNMTPDAGIPPYGCYAYGYWLDWDDTLIEIQSYNAYPPEDIWDEGVFVVEDQLEDIDIDTKDDRHSYSVTALGNPPGFTGVRKIANYTFKVIYEPVFSDASCLLDITNRGFADANEDPISMTVYDGLYEIAALSPLKPKLFVDPPNIYDASLAPCENFTVDIKIANVTNLYNVSLKLGFNETILEATEVEEGPFLKSFGTSTVNNLEINNTEGYIWISLSLVTGGPAIGDGTLANVTLHVIDIGECVLDLYDTELTDDVGGKLPHDVSNGYFNNVLMPRIFVDPPSIIDPTLLPPSVFAINISIGNITNMYDYVFKLGYNTEILNCISVNIIPFNNETHFTPIIFANDPVGTIYVNVTYFDPAPPITTIPPVAFATIEFQVTGLGSSVFDLYDTHLSDPTGASILHAATDGFLSIATRDVSILGVEPSTNVAYVGQLVNITVVAGNEGDLTETFNVSAYYNDNLIETKTIKDLPSGENETLVFTWNTLHVQPCINYTIKADAEVVPYETDTADNEYVDGKVKIKMVGDIDGDGKVDIFDMRIVAKAFGSMIEDDPDTSWDETETWNSEVDFIVDGKIDIFDVRIVAKHYGESC